MVLLTDRLFYISVTMICSVVKLLTFVEIALLLAFVSELLSYCIFLILIENCEFKVQVLSIRNW